MQRDFIDQYDTHFARPYSAVISLRIFGLMLATLLLATSAAPRLSAGGGETEFNGFVTAIDGPEWTIGGRTVVVTDSTEIEDDDGPLVVGACVEVEGSLLPNGSVAAEEISSEDPEECEGPGDDNSGDDNNGDDNNGDDDNADDDDVSDDRDDAVGEFEIKGFIDFLPNGLIGEWSVDGRRVLVSDSTELESEDGPFVAGACVEVEGYLQPDGVLLAKELKTDDDCSSGGGDDDADDDDIEFFADLLELPPDGRIGDWIVGETRVRVLAGTEIENDRGPVALGVCLKVEGRRQADGSVLAEEIEVRSAAGGCASRSNRDDDDEAEFEGIVQNRPADPGLGLWLISGRTVIVDESTAVDFDDADDGLVGSCVEVEGSFVEGGAILASSLDDDDDCREGRDHAAEVEVKGLIQAIPAGGLLGDWQISGIRVIVSASTEIDEDDDDGVLGIGVCAKAKGRLLPDGSLDARELETEGDDDCSIGTIVEGEIEFRGSATAAPADPPIGLWTIAGQQVEVREDTELDDLDGSLLIGACVKVEGRLQSDGSILAREIEVETSSGSCFAADAVVNSATFNDGPISPGEILSIFGLRLGPAAGAGLEVGDDDRVRSRLSGVRVWFDSTPAPILFARDDQVNVVAPYSIAGKQSVQVQVEWRGAWSRALELPVRPASPGLLTLDQSGAGQAAALTVGANGQVSVNGPEAPASPGQAVTLFAVGMGAFRQSFDDGLVVGDDLPELELDVRVTIGGQSAQVLYAGGAPGLVLGVVQINAIIPDGVTPGAAPVVVEVGDFSTQAGVTLAIQ